MLDFMPFFRKEPESEYERLAAQVVLMQADSEFAGAYGYYDLVPIIQRYSLEEMLIVSKTAHEEFEHALRCFKILDDMGFDSDSWVWTHDKNYRWRIKEGKTLAVLGARPTNDGRVNIFYYPLALPGNPTHTAIRFAIFQFLQDRGAGVQLQDALNSNFAPWAKENREIMLEEQDHLEHGERKLAELRREYPKLVDREIKLWLPRVVATFGKPNSEFDKQLRKHRITSRTHEEKLRDFLDGDEGIHTANERSNIGLTLPSTDEIIDMWQKGHYLKTI